MPTKLWGLFRAINWVASATFLHSAITLVQAQPAMAVGSVEQLLGNPLALRVAVCLLYLCAFFGISVVSTSPAYWADSVNRPKKRVLSAELALGAGTILYGVCATEDATVRTVLAAGFCGVVALRQVQH